MALWWLGLAGTAMSVAAFTLLGLSLRRMEGNVRRVYIYIFMAAFVYLVAGSLEMVYGLMGLGTTHVLWDAVPVLYFLAAAPWLLGIRTLLEMAEKTPGGGD